MNGTSRRLALAVAIIMAALLVSYALYLIVRAGVFRTLVSVSPGICQTVPGFDGPEDVAIDHVRGLAYIPSDAGFGKISGKPGGRIHILDLASAPPRIVNEVTLGARAFFPHGIDLYIGPTGERLLFAVNHGAGGEDHSIEVFRVGVDGRSLMLIRTLRRDALSHPNDITVLSPERFFVTNDLGGSTEFWRQAEPYLMAPWASVAEYRDGEAQTIISGLVYANGITYNSDRRRLYVAEAVGKRVSAYDLRKDRLDKAWTLALPMAVDNLTLAPDGRIWAAGHPKMFAFTAHARDNSKPSPSEVIMIDDRADAPPRWRTILLDNGNLVSGASTAAVHDGKLYIGSVYGKALIVCEPERARDRG